MSEATGAFRIRFSLKWLLAWVAIAGVVFAGLLSGDMVWVEILRMLTLATLVFAGIAALFGKPESRPFWCSFLIGAGIYFACHVYPGGRADLIPTTPLLSALHDQLVPFHAAQRAEPDYAIHRVPKRSWGYMVGPNQYFGGETTWDSTLWTGRWVFTIAFGLIAAMAGDRVAKRRAAKE